MATSGQVNTDLHYFSLRGANLEHSSIPAYSFPDHAGRIAGNGTTGLLKLACYNCVSAHYATLRNDGAL